MACQRAIYVLRTRLARRLTLECLTMVLSVEQWLAKLCSKPYPDCAEFAAMVIATFPTLTKEAQIAQLANAMEAWGDAL